MVNNLYIKTIWHTLFSMLICSVNAQINMADSSAQAITYWSKGDKEVYSISLEKIRLKGTDTSSKDRISYEVELSVLNQSDKSYTLQWLYKNFSSSNNSPAIQKLISLSKDLKVQYKTDEMGVFNEVLNWKEIREYMQKASKQLSQDLSASPEAQEMLKQSMAIYSNKEAIEAAAIQDIQQYHTFHGARYSLGEVLESQVKLPNLYSAEPLDCEVMVYMDELNEQDNNFIVRSEEQVNKEQLIDATLAYFLKMHTAKDTPLTREDLKDLKNETLTASRIHGTGWIVYSVQTRTITIDDITNIEERIIEIKDGN